MASRLKSSSALRGFILYCFNSSVLGPAEGIAAYHGVIWQIAICGEF